MRFGSAGATRIPHGWQAAMVPARMSLSHVSLDEKPITLHADVRPVLPAGPGGAPR